MELIARLIVAAVVIEAAESLRPSPRPGRSGPPERLYDPYSLATRPLPAGLRLHPHPRGISAEAAQRITGGVFC